MICQDQYQRNFRPFVHEYFIRINKNILYVYINISPAFIFFMNVRPPIITIFPCSLLSNVFSCSSLRRKNNHLIYHLTITAGFQLSHSGLEFKQTEAIGFFPICTTITREGWGGQCGWLNYDKEDEVAGTCLYMPSISHTEFHTPNVPVKKAWNSQRIISEYQPDVKQFWNHKWNNYLHIIKSSYKLLHKLQIN